MDIYQDARKKKRLFSSLIFALLCVIAAIIPAAAQLKTFAGKKISVAEMDRFLRRQMDSLGLPAVSIAVINESKISYHSAMGVMDVESGKKIDNATLFEAAVFRLID